MNIKLLITLALLVPFSASAQNMDKLKEIGSSDALKGMADSRGGSVTDLLQGQLGINKDQAEGGLGSMLTLANEKLSSGEFEKIAGMIPGAEGYMQAAKTLGAVTGPIGDLAGLNSALGNLGISPDVVSKFVPTVRDAIGSMDRGSAASLLSKAFGS